MDIFIAILTLAAVTAIPALELRASIPLGFFAYGDTLHWGWVVLICVLSNILLGIVTYEILLPILEFFRKHWSWFNRRVWPMVERRRDRLRATVERHGEWGLALFIGVPLPGTGAVTGAVGAFLLDFRRKNFYLANFLGVLIAGACVAALCLLIQNGVVAEDSWISRLFMKEIEAPVVP